MFLTQKNNISQLFFKKEEEKKSWNMNGLAATQHELQFFLSQHPILENFYSCN
jgi:hypothetical protein